MMKKKVMLIAVAIVAIAAAANAGMIYSETFDGDGTTGLDGSVPTAGGNTWGAKGEFIMTDGSIDGKAGANLLPFDPVAGKVYTLSMDLNHTGTKYIGIGFSKAGTNDSSKADTGYRFPQNGGIAFMHYGQGGAIDMYEGLNAYTDGVKNATIPTTGVYAGQTWVNLKIVLDTAGDGSSFTADFMIDDVSISSGPFQIDLPIEDINYAGISSYGTRSGASPAGSIVDNFEISVVPEPATIALLAFGGLSLIRRRRNG